MKKGSIYALLAVLMVSAFAAAPAAVMAGEADDTLYYGVGSLVVDLDPHQAWDSASIDVIDQVCEGLFGYNLSDPELAIVPVLSTDMGTWNAEADVFTVTLKQGVTFHDGSTLTADDVVYTFDRLNALIESGDSQIAELYEPLAGVYPGTPLVINKTEAVDDYTVKFTLNYPYVAFVPLLCFSGSVILPEDEYPTDALMDVATDTLIGTGPYKYIEQTDEYTKLEYFEDWHGERPEKFIKNIMFLYYEDGTAKNQAFLAGDIDWVDGASPEFLEQYEESEFFSVQEQRKSTVILYMGMNNKRINQPMRQAISYAIDYDYIIEEIALGNAERMTSPVPEGILYHNPDCEPATYNVTKARQILIDNDLAPVGAADHLNDSEYWRDLAATQPVGIYNYTWNTGNEVRADLGVVVMNNLRDIGIYVALTGMTWGEYLDRLLGDFDKLELYMIGWAPDYNDPSNYINPLFSNTSLSNGAQVNDPELQDMMMEGLMETNATARRQLYYDMQEYIVEDLMPWIFLYVPLSRSVWSVTFGGVQRNPMGKLWFASMYWTGVAGPGGSGGGDDSTGGGIPGYSFIGLLGAAAIALGVIYKKRK